MGTAATANQVLNTQEDGIIPLALKVVFGALPGISKEYSIITKVSFMDMHTNITICCNKIQAFMI